MDRDERDRAVRRVHAVIFSQVSSLDTNIAIVIVIVIVSASVIAIVGVSVSVVSTACLGYVSVTC